MIIPGLDRGLESMREGGVRSIFIPSRLGYGATGTKRVPPNTDLVFEVELVRVQ